LHINFTARILVEEFISMFEYNDQVVVVNVQSKLNADQSSPQQAALQECSGIFQMNFAYTFCSNVGFFVSVCSDIWHYK
jgi:hypothetical protein